MDKRVNYRIVIDTETCPIDNTLEKVSPYNMLTYDIGWAVVDKRGNVYKTESFVVAEIYCGERERMKSAYYANKLPQYEKAISEHTRKLCSIFTIRKQLLNDIAEYNITEIYAHNMRFDCGALNQTIRKITDERIRYFFPYNLKICDTLKMSRDVLSTMPTYKEFCTEHDFLTARGACRYTAEIIFRFIKRDLDFAESHTGLEDVLIEKEILAYCYKQHKKMRRLLYN